MISHAKDIAIRDLRACYGPHGILAGRHHFDDYWARDSFYAIPGALAIGDHEKVKTHLDFFCSVVRIDGLVPLRIGKSAKQIVLKYIGINKNDMHPHYHFHLSDKPAMDSNALFIIAFHAYVMHGKEYGYARKHFDLLKLVCDWYTFHMQQDLVQEHPYSTWADSIKKKGAVHYTNVCYARALWCMYELAKKLRVPYKSYKDRFDQMCFTIREKFWTGEHFADWIDDGKIFNYYSTDGNTLAILWDVATKEQARHIEEAGHIFDLHDVPSQCVHPHYKKKHLSSVVKLLGIPDYHNGMSWLWLGCINALAKYHLGMKKEARDLLKTLAQIIVRHDGVYEIYEQDGSPVNRLRYKAEQPFAWSAGIFLWACDQIL